MKENEKLYPIAKYYLANEEVCYGIGKQQLLETINKTGCVHLACEKIGLSYSKAWKMIRAMERQLGYGVVLRKQGGRSGGNSTLTSEGKKLVERYEAFSNESNKKILKVFKKYFIDMCVF